MSAFRIGHYKNANLEHSGGGNLDSKDRDMRKFLAAFTSAVAVIHPGVALAQTLDVPSPDEAKGAVIRMMDDPGLTKLLSGGHVKVGTCKKTAKTQHEGEVACTLALVMGAGSSETQANFYRANGLWVAEPTEEKLPFPDTKLLEAQ